MYLAAEAENNQYTFSDDVSTTSLPIEHVDTLEARSIRPQK